MRICSQINTPYGGNSFSNSGVIDRGSPSPIGLVVAFDTEKNVSQSINVKLGDMGGYKSCKV